MKDVDTLLGNRYITEMLFAGILVVLPHRKRSNFMSRAVIFCAVTEMLSLFIMNIASIKGIWKNWEVISSSIYVAVFAVLSVSFICFCCPVSVKEAIYCSALCLCIQHFSSSLLIVVRYMVPQQEFMLGWLMWLATILIPYSLFYLFCFRHICKHGTYQVSALNLTTATCLIFLTSAFISIIAKGLKEGDDSPLFIISQIYEMLCCLFMLWMQVHQVNALALQHELDIQGYLQHLRREQFIQSHKDLKLMTHLMHELKHQIADMVIEGNEAVKDDLLEQIGENLQIYDELSNTKNETLNTVLMERRLFCRVNHISWMVVADGEQLNFLNIDDLYLIFRNALDNAIEGVVQLEDPQRRIIDVRVYTQNRILAIQIENEFKGKLQFVDGLPLTTKPNPAYHGFGLKAIQQVVQSYNGQILVRVRENRFTLQIVMPFPQP